MDENHSKSHNDEKQVFLSESEELSKEESPADFDISVEELTAKLAEKKHVEEKKISEEKLRELNRIHNKVQEEKNTVEIKEEYSKLPKEESKTFLIKIEEEKEEKENKSFSIKIEEEEKKEEHSSSQPADYKRPITHNKTQTIKHKTRTYKTFIQRQKWIITFAILLVISYFWFHPTQNNLNSFSVNEVKDVPKESVVEIPQTPPVEKIDLRKSKLKEVILEGLKD